MSIQTFSSVAQLASSIHESIDSFDVVSFDMFDTLLVRRVFDPDMVKNATTRYIDNIARQKGLWSSYRLVDNLRKTIEDEHRTRNGKEHPDHEANYDQFMPEVLKKHFGSHYSTALFEQIAAHEMCMESEMLVARQEFVELLAFLKEKDKRMFLLSDMYLPNHYLQRLLADKEMDNYFEAIVSSADSFRAKASGTAYPLLEEQYKLDKARWIHVGDNRWSDGEKPAEFGLKAFIIADKQEEKRKNIAKRYDFLGKKQPIWAGRCLQQIMLPMEAENIERSELYADGYQFFAYVFGTMLFNLKKRADDLGIKKLYFCAREGWMLKKCWELMAPKLWPEEVDQYELHYLYVSRLSLGKASRANVGLTILDIENALRPVNNKDFTDVARVYGLDLEPLLPFLEKVGLTAESDISAISRTQDKYVRLVLLCDDEEFIDAVKEQAKESNQALCAYLRDEGFLSQPENHETNVQPRVALIDIGWVGTIQSSLNQAISHCQNERPIIHGFFMASNAMANIYPPSHHSQIEGLLFDDARFSSVASILTSCKDIFEEVTRASHPTLLEYQLKEGKDKKVEDKGFHLHFRSEEHDSFAKETAQFTLYKDLHQGVFDGVERFAAALAVQKYDAEVLLDWCNVLIIGKLGLPSNKEVKRLKNQYHQDDFSRQGKQREVNKHIQKQLNREQTVWTKMSGFNHQYFLGKVWLLNRFIKQFRRR